MCRWSSAGAARAAAAAPPLASPAPTPVAMSGAVRGAHFFRKLPRELTEATQLGGIVSLVGIATAIR